MRHLFQSLHHRFRVVPMRFRTGTCYFIYTRKAE